MRPRGSITGPLVIIFLGIVFLLHAISPDFPLLDWMGQYWPYLLIVWGVVALAEVAIRTLRGGPIPVNGVSGGAWLVVILITIGGLTLFHVRGSNSWWEHTDWGRGFDSAFGQEHEYAVNAMQKEVGAAPHIILENFRGDAKVTGGAGSALTMTGHKTIRAFKDEAADRTDAATPVEVLVEGKNVVIRCNQKRAEYRTSVTTNLDLTVPQGASLEVNTSAGDFEIAALAGNVSVHGGTAGVRLQDVGGNVEVETRRSDLVRCTGVKGTVDLRGHGSDVELNKIEGQVTINGDYTGTLSLRALNKPAHVQNMRTDVQVERVAGEVRMDRGSLSVTDATGPVRVTTHSTDVSVEGVTNALDISVDRGDVDLKPGRLPLGKIAVRAGAGDIVLSLPQAAGFVLSATTDRGQVENEFGEGLKGQTTGRGGRLEGSVGSGPNVDLVTGRGSITVRRSSENAQATSVAAVQN